MTEVESESVRLDDIEGFAEGEGGAGTIKLNRYQRKLLGLETPLQMSAEHLSLFLSGLGDDDRAFVEQAYPAGLLDSGLAFAERARVFSLLCRGGYGRIHIAGLHQDDRAAGDVADEGGAVFISGDSRGPGQAVCDFFLRTSTMVLMCVRPYDLDEGRDVIRISPDTMTLLGVDEGDSVRSRYGSVESRARVLCLDNESAIMQTNLLDGDASFDHLVGIPASLRNRLGINSLGMTIVVERDTKFLFKRHLNVQFFSIIAMLFTIWQTVEVFNINPIHATIAFFVLLPIVLYLILSPERSRVQKLK